MFRKHKKICFNPFKKPAARESLDSKRVLIFQVKYDLEIFVDSKCESDLRRVTHSELRKLDGADENSLLCSNCRKELRANIPDSPETQPQSQNSESQCTAEKPSSQGSTSQVFDVGTSIDVLLGVSPVKRKL